MSKSRNKQKATGIPETFSVPNPDAVQIVEPNDVDAVKDVGKAVLQSLRDPIESLPIADMVKDTKLAIILVPDFTRRIPLPAILKALMKELHKAGLDRHRMGVIVALGTHSALEDDELEELVGLDVYNELAVLNHDWKNEYAMATVGALEDGTPIKVNEMVKDADLLIGIGQIRPHRIAGYTGGGKVVVPGISGASTLGKTHWFSAEMPSEELTFQADNPIRLVMEDGAMKAGLGFIINVVMTPSEKVAAVFSGHPVKAHREGVRFAETVYPRPQGETFDVVIASCPHDTDLWQAASGIHEGSLWVKNGGTLILHAPCPEGVAPHHPDVLKHGYLPREEAQVLVDGGKIKDLVVAAHMAHVGDVHHKKSRVTLVSDGISQDETEALGLDYGPDLQSAVDAALIKQGKDASILVYRR